MAVHTGRHFLQIPGPTNVPDRVLRAMDMPTIDHRGPEFAVLAHEVLSGIQSIFRTSQPVIIYPSSGTGAWEAAIVNTLSPGDRVLMAETGQFATLWRNLATRMKLDVDFIEGDWRRGAVPQEIEARLFAAILTRFGLKSPLSPKLIARIKQADHAAAYYEATRLAGFSDVEARRFFGSPRGVDPEQLDLTPWPAVRAEARFLARFRVLARAAEAG